MAICNTTKLKCIACQPCCGSRIGTYTFQDGKELKNYDKAIDHIKEIEKYFIETTEYNGYPLLPDCSFSIQDIYDNANNDEKNAIFIIIYTKLLEAYRHWASDKDNLWRDENIEKHEEFVAKCKLMGIWRKDQRNWDGFFGLE